VIHAPKEADINSFDELISKIMTSGIILILSKSF